jgi:hypothetical protein
VGAGVAPGTDPGIYVQQQVQTAQQDLDHLKSKIASLGGNSGSGDMVMPDFKPDHQKNRSFLQRLEYTVNWQTSPATPVLPVISDIGVGIGYKLTDNFTAGTGLSYKLGLGRSIDHISFSNQGVGIRSYADIRAKGSLWISGGFEYNYWQQFSSIHSIKDLSLWQRSALIGVTKKYSIDRRRQGSLQLLYDLLSASQIPHGQPLKFRIGYSL